LVKRKVGLLSKTAEQGKRKGVRKKDHKEVVMRVEGRRFYDLAQKKRAPVRGGDL